MQPTQFRNLPESLGFRPGRMSVHQSRTMMSGELAQILDRLPVDASTSTIRSAIIEDNLLGKATRSTRLRSATYVASLYGLDSSRAVYRLLRHFWHRDRPGQPMLTYLAASARDGLLRDCSGMILGVPEGDRVDWTTMSQMILTRYPARFRPSTLRSTSQNLASTWTQAGYLVGKIAKQRVHPVITPIVATYALVLGYLTGLRGQILMESSWVKLLDLSTRGVLELATEASKQGWLKLKVAGPVVEVTFPGLLTPQEERLAHDPH